MNLNISQNNKIYQENKNSKLNDYLNVNGSSKRFEFLWKKKREKKAQIKIQLIKFLKKLLNYHEMILIEKKVKNLR